MRVKTPKLMQVDINLFTHVLSCCNNYCSFIKRQQVVRTMLLTIDVVTMLFRNENNNVQGLFSDKTRDIPNMVCIVVVHNLI